MMFGKSISCLGLFAKRLDRVLDAPLSSALTSGDCGNKEAMMQVQCLHLVINNVCI